MNFQSCELPGIGTKYDLEAESGDTVAMVFTEGDKVQLYVLSKGKRERCAAVLTSLEARRVGNVLTGAIMETDREGVEFAFSSLADLRIRMHTYFIPDSVAGKTLAELAIRSRTGTTIVAVGRGSETWVNPGASFRFENGDMVLVIGEAHQICNFEKEMLGE